MEEEGGRVRPSSIWAKARFGEGVVIGNLDTGRLSLPEHMVHIFSLESFTDLPRHFLHVRRPCLSLAETESLRLGIGVNQNQ
jgi:hypothetical protein